MTVRETGLYYLQSRYYNPTWGRFLNADGYTSTGQGMLSNNMFCYCLNNPVNYSDYTGFKPEYNGDPMYEWAWDLGWLLKDWLYEQADQHYARNDLNSAADDIDEILKTYDKQPETADVYHENTNGNQGSDAVYNDKYLSPNGGHYEVIICTPPGKDPYIVDEYVDPINMGTYNYASNDQCTVVYWGQHFMYDMVPYYIFGNTRGDSGGILKWCLG